MKHSYSFIIVALLVGIASFYAGMQYQMRQRSNFGEQFAGRMGRLNGAGGPNAMQGSQRGMTGMTPVGGEIISQDDTSVTVKMLDGSSKIVILSENTIINKSSTGSKNDLKTGEQITVFGTQNQDGSVTAQNISIGGMMFRARGGLPTPSAEPTKQ